MTTISSYALFNLKANEFMHDLDGVLTDMYDFILFKQGLKMIAACDETSLSHYYRKYIVSPYRKYIISRDENFFLNNIGEEDIVDVDPGDFDFSILDIIKSKWRSLTDDDKNAIWQHLELLVILCDRCEQADAMCQKS